MAENCSFTKMSIFYYFIIAIGILILSSFYIKYGIWQKIVISVIWLCIVITCFIINYRTLNANNTRNLFVSCTYLLCLCADPRHRSKCYWGPLSVSCLFNNLKYCFDTDNV